MHIAWKLIYFCIDSWIKTSEIWNDSQNIRSFLKPQIELFWNFSIHPWIATMTSKEKTKWKSLWMDLRNPWTNFKWLSIAAFWFRKNMDKKTEIYTYTHWFTSVATKSISFNYRRTKFAIYCNEIKNFSKIHFLTHTIPAFFSNYFHTGFFPMKI